MIGQQVGTYRILNQLGEGGMGVVYRAQHAMLGRPAAIKILLPQYSANREIVQRFFNEARAATQIQHPGIVEIYDFGVMPDGIAYIAMELLNGESLSARMTRGRLSVSHAVAIIRQMAGALAAAHQIGIVHRDLKPDNVFLVPDPEVAGGERIKLLDFGIAKLNTDGMNSQKTRTGSLMGTPAYMAPEQCRGVKLDHRADIYSLGCMLHELIAGRPPFIGEGAGDVLGAHMYQAPKPLEAQVANLPPGLSGFVNQLLAKDPLARPQTCGDLIASIDHIMGGQPRTFPPGTNPYMDAAKPTTLSGAAASSFITPGKRRRAPLLIGAGLVVTAAAVAIVLVANNSGATTEVPTTKPAEPIAAAAPAVAAAPAHTAPPAPTTIHVVIDSKPPASHVLDGDKDLGTTPFDQQLPRSAATLIVRQAGYKDATVALSGQDDVTRDVQLEPIAKSKPAKPKATKIHTETKTDDKVDDNGAVNPFAH